jgi:hypothetical protein
MSKSEIKYKKKYLNFVSRNLTATQFLHTIVKIFFWNIQFLTSTYDLYAPCNMGRFRLDRVCTKHVVNVTVKSLSQSKPLFTAKISQKWFCLMSVVNVQSNIRTTAWQVSTNCQIFPIKSVLYCKTNKVENLLVKFDSFV